jgi:hypothetical protein
MGPMKTCPRFQRGDRVRIKARPWAGHRGTVVDVSMLSAGVIVDVAPGRTWGFAPWELERLPAEDDPGIPPPCWPRPVPPDRRRRLRRPARGGRC